MAKDGACEKVGLRKGRSRHGVGSPEVAGPRPAAVAGASFGSAARHKQWPAAWLCRKGEEIGSNDLAGQRIFHNGSARRAP